jgi:hypothetical protein
MIRGVARNSDHVGASEGSRLLDRLSTAIDESPSSEYGWRSLQGIFGTERLAGLLGTSPTRVRRYHSGARSMPYVLAARLHFLAALVGDLAGAYNELGIRRWFDRPRSLLDGRTPADILQGDWHPEAPEPQRLRDLARSLAASPAT